jgi:hypothetical protein
MIRFRELLTSFSRRRKSRRIVQERLGAIRRERILSSVLRAGIAAQEARARRAIPVDYMALRDRPYGLPAGVEDWSRYGPWASLDEQSASDLSTTAHVHNGRLICTQTHFDGSVPYPKGS